MRRELPKVFSLGDPNRVKILVENLSTQKLKLKVIDEIPIQFQIRNFEKVLELEPEEAQTIIYPLTPKSRGEYEFGNVNVFHMLSILFNVILLTPYIFSHCYLE